MQKFKNLTSKDMTLRGVKFPKGQPVEVKDESLARKVAAMPEFENVQEGES